MRQGGGGRRKARRGPRERGGGRRRSGSQSRGIQDRLVMIKREGKLGHTIELSRVEGVEGGRRGGGGSRGGGGGGTTEGQRQRLMDLAGKGTADCGH